MTLYELTDEMRTLLDLLEEEQDETEQKAIEDTLQMVVLDLNDKVEGYCMVIRQLESDAAAVKAEKMRLAKKQTTLENNAMRLREALKSAMLLTDQRKMKTKICTLSVGTRQKAFLDLPVNEISPDFWKKRSPEADMTAIEKFLKEGHEVDFAHLEPVENLTMR